jgi:peptidoglycan/xylan/chitin deacetylase (PgdA/CDA1 family)
MPMVSFVFDDGNDTDYLVGREVFAAHGAVASTAVTTAFIGTPEHLTAAQIVALQASGWEIMAHTVTHPNLTSLAPRALEAELAAAKTALESLGVIVNNIVYPYNKNDAQVRSMASRYYRSGRGGTNAFNVDPVDPYFIRSFALKHDPARMKSLIDTAHAEGSWLVLYQHEINAKVRISAYNGSFLPGETVTLAPSGTVGRFVTTHWFPLYGFAVYFVPLAGAPAVGDTLRGEQSGASAVIDSISYNERQQLAELLSHTRKNYPDMPIVTIDQALDYLKIRKFAGVSNEKK